MRGTPDNYSLRVPYAAKYGTAGSKPGSALPWKHCAVFGRQILEGATFLYKVGWKLGAHLCSANVIP